MNWVKPTDTVVQDKRSRLFYVVLDPAMSVVTDSGTNPVVLLQLIGTEIRNTTLKEYIAVTSHVFGRDFKEVPNLNPVEPRPQPDSVDLKLQLKEIVRDFKQIYNTGEVFQLADLMDSYNRLLDWLTEKESTK